MCDINTLFEEALKCNPQRLQMLIEDIVDGCCVLDRVEREIVFACLRLVQELQTYGLISIGKKKD